MTRLVWNAPGERIYENGCYNGVLYVASDAGVAWSGLISVNETPNGGEARPYYLDGQKYLNLSTAEEFEATITAYNSPKEFAPCDGTMQIQNGLFATQQPRKQFSLSYSNLVGNDQTEKLGRKIHLVYNALAGPTSRLVETQGADIDPFTFSWSITTLPPEMTGLKPTGHLVIDSRYTTEDILNEVQDILYGSDANAPRMPTPAELIDIFTP